MSDRPASEVVSQSGLQTPTRSEAEPSRYLTHPPLTTREREVLKQAKGAFETIQRLKQFNAISASVGTCALDEIIRILEGK